MRAIQSLFLRASGILLVSVALGCNTGGVRDVIDVALNEPDRQTIDTNRLGVNAFVNDSRFGSIATQFAEVKNTLRVNRVRVLFAWNDAVQPSPSSAPNFSFYDDIAATIPDGVEALVVLTGIPSWMSNSANWTEGNPRITFAERWVRAVATRYGANPRIVGWEIWNEPNMSDGDNATMGFADSAENYVEMLARSFSVSKDLAPGKLVLNAATTAINQNYPSNLNYNRGMRDAGALSFTDRWNVHYYGKQYENVVRDGGVADFLNGLPKPVWITESGIQGVNKQLEYAERVWPFLMEEIPSIERVYQYQFTDSTAPDVSFGLRNLSSDFPVSDLYIWLRDR
jgi:hypothetical protein